jgi:hypothetical protein
MQPNQDLLGEAIPYCDATTGEVRERIPEELMQRLRRAKLAVGVGGRRAERCGTSATWFVFFNEAIRAQALERYRAHRRRRKAPAPVAAVQPKPPASRGLGSFRRRPKT